MKRVAFGFLIIGLLFASVSWVRNPFFEFCTTHAFGWPLPWRMDYCACADESGQKRERTAYPIVPWILSAGVSSAVGISFERFARRRQLNP